MISGDSLRGLAIDENGQVYVDDGKSLAETSGVEKVKQSVAISARKALRPLVGESVTGEQLERAAEAVRRELNRDEQLDDVLRVSIDTVDLQRGTVTITATTSYNEQFTLEDIGVIDASN